MNKFLYKYMPLREDFFTNPMIRATPSRALNDPFEGHFNKPQVLAADRNIGDFYRKNGKNTYEMSGSEVDDRMGLIQSELSDLGIISFSEDFDNPLMWAHYADEHKGMVVEFDLKEPFFMDSLKEVNGRKSRFGMSYLADCYEFPEKVNYRRVMPSFDRPEFSAPESMKDYHYIKFNHAILFTKSEDWIYEKEQRSIVRLKDADSIICKDCPHIRKLLSSVDSIELSEPKDKKIQITYPREYEMHDEMADKSIKAQIHRLTQSYDEPSIHLFRVNPAAISGVYFGYKATESSAMKNITENKSIKASLKINKMRLNDALYQLDSNKCATHAQ